MSKQYDSSESSEYEEGAEDEMDENVFENREEEEEGMGNEGG
jgi:hypothetical protein